MKITRENAQKIFIIVSGTRQIGNKYLIKKSQILWYSEIFKPNINSWSLFLAYQDKNLLVLFSTSIILPDSGSISLSTRKLQASWGYHFFSIYKTHLVFKTVIYDEVSTQGISFELNWINSGFREKESNKCIVEYVFSKNPKSYFMEQTNRDTFLQTHVTKTIHAIWHNSLPCGNHESLTELNHWNYVICLTVFV